MKKIKINRSLFITAILMMGVGLLIGWIINPFSSGKPVREEHETTETDTTTATIWTCSMHPQVRRLEPGKCPICGMDLIPLETGTSGKDPMEIRMSSTAMQLANVQTAIVGQGIPFKEVRMNGKVQPDERLISSQVTHIDGRVEQLHINFTGEPVQKGQVLATIYSPDLVTAQEELFTAMKLKDMQPALYDAAKQKLRNWRLTEQQIENIIEEGKPQERFAILADISGIVKEKKVNLGDYVMRGMPLYDIIDLSRVWLLFDIYESDMSWAKVGSTVKFTIQSLTGEEFSGKIAFIDPVINPMTRVATARVEVNNPGRRLKPEMFASGVIKTQLAGKSKSIIIPKSAVLWTGERSVVYVKTASSEGAGFLMREVKLGPLASDGYIIVDGLVMGEEIAVNGTFSIDAAAQLAGKPSMMNPEGAAMSTGHRHGSEAMTSPASSTDITKEMRLAIQKLITLYFHVKDALVDDDLMAAKKRSEELRQAFEKTSMSLFTGSAHNVWMSYSEMATGALKNMISAGDIEIARENFKDLSMQMIGLATSFGPFESVIFVQHCPMAFNNRGADWLSEAKEIRNPYFGNKMLKCGSVTEIIQKK